MTTRAADEKQWGRSLRRWPEAESRAQLSVDVRLPAFEVWRSRQFLVSLYNEDGNIRVSVNRTHKPNGIDWAEGISWDDLMQIKREIGRSEQWAVEILPADSHIVDVANMRHFWLLDEPPSFGWRRGGEDALS